MSFVTDAMVEAGLDAACAESCLTVACSGACVERGCLRLSPAARQRGPREPVLPTPAMIRAALNAVAPLWLAHVQHASEHTADYRTAERAAAVRRRLATTEGGSTT